MPLNTSTLRPGLLVSLKTSIKGNVRYFKEVLQPNTDEDDGATVAEWKTRRRIADAKEHDAASKLRSRARQLIRSVCADSAFGLLCPEDKSSKLDEALAEAAELVVEFNKTARFSRIDFYWMTGRIEADDVSAVRAINSEIRDLMETMQSGIGKLDVDAIRDAASKARSVGQMLSPGAQARVNEAIDAARSIARQIVKAGDLAAQEIDQQALATIDEARMAFLDFDPAAEVEVVAENGRAVDMMPEDLPPPVFDAGAEANRSIEL